ncbi:hypothetical protein D3C87_2003110 [compost metagenome]
MGRLQDIEQNADDARQEASELVEEQLEVRRQPVDERLGPAADGDAVFGQKFHRGESVSSDQHYRAMR